MLAWAPGQLAAEPRPSGGCLAARRCPESRPPVRLVRGWSSGRGELAKPATCDETAELGPFSDGGTDLIEYHVDDAVAGPRYGQSRSTHIAP